MKTTLALVSLLFGFQNHALAGYGGCNTDYLFTCTATYHLSNGTVDQSNSSGSEVSDLQPEPFDPSDCEASAVLYTLAGKFVATYSQASGKISAFLDTQDGKEIMIQPASSTASNWATAEFTAIPSKVLSVDSTSFECHVKFED